MTKNTIRILVIAVVAGLFVAAVWKGSQHFQKANISDTTPEESATVSASPTALATPPTIEYGAAGKDWIQYSSKSLGFKVSYPKDWVENSCGEGCVAWAPASASEQLVTGISVSEGSLSDLVTRAAPYTLASASMTFNKIEWLRLFLREPQTGAIFTSHYAVSGTKIYEFGINTTDASILDIYGRMISSFVFLKK